MSIIKFTKKPPQKDWLHYACRANYATTLAATNAFGRSFHVIRIEWDRAGGYPEHAWGHVQYSVRPVYPGFGCDGTTDSEHHARCRLLLERLGLDADKLYAKAYVETRKSGSRLHDSVKHLSPDTDFILPEGVPGAHEIQDMLYDLYQLNNRSYVYEIEKALEKKRIRVPDYNSPATVMPRVPVPKSGAPLRILTRTKSENDGWTEYYLKEGSQVLVLCDAHELNHNRYFHGMWWDDPKLLSQLEGMRSDRERKKHLVSLIMNKQAPESVLEFAGRML